MKKFRKIISIVLVSILASGLVGCNANTAEKEVSTPVASKAEGVEEKVEADAENTDVQEGKEAQKEETEPTQEAVNTSYPITLKDQAGREVEITKKPEKIVSGYYISTSTLIALGLEDKLVGIEAKADKRPIYKLSAPELIALPNVGTAKEFDLEGCAALAPDLVILPKKLKDAAATLEGLGMTVLLVNPESKEQLEEMVDLLAKATDSQENGSKLLAFAESNQSALDEKLAEASAPTVYLAGNSSVLSTAGKAMYQSSLIKNAGGKNVADETEDTYWAEVSYEQILAWNPEYIIIVPEATYSVEELLADPALASCSAVKNHQVFQMPNKAEAWDSPVPSSILGTIWLASIIHSDLVSDTECEAIISEYYNTFYGFSYKED